MLSGISRPTTASAPTCTLSPILTSNHLGVNTQVNVVADSRGAGAAAVGCVSMQTLR